MHESYKIIVYFLFVFVFSEDFNLTSSKVNEACDKGCNFTFSHHGYVYNGSCLVDGNIPIKFLTVSTAFEVNPSNGWSYCSDECTIEKYFEFIEVRASTERTVANLATTEQATEQDSIYIIIFVIVLTVLGSIPFFWLLYQRLIID